MNAKGDYNRPRRTKTVCIWSTVLEWCETRYHMRFELWVSWIQRIYFTAEVTRSCSKSPASSSPLLLCWKKRVEAFTSLYEAVGVSTSEVQCPSMPVKRNVMSHNQFVSKEMGPVFQQTSVRRVVKSCLHRRPHRKHATVCNSKHID